MAIVTIEKPRRDKLGDEAADSLVRLLNQSQEDQKNDIVEFVEEKFERRLIEELTALEKRLVERISEGDKKLDARITSLETRIAETHADLIKWMFIFWVGQVGVILGILFAFFK